jgi:5-methyltetrahydropteroyltriglutamate--homocysteine methyltransferase
VIKSCDSGSIPFPGDLAKFLEGAEGFTINEMDESVEYFEEMMINSFVDKIQVGLDVPNYPQFRDMNQMFLSMIDGIEEVDKQNLILTNPSLKPDKRKIAEVVVLEKNSNIIEEKINTQFESRVCITGPYTLASLFSFRDETTFTKLGGVLSEILENNLFSNKHGKTSLVSVDEPLFGLVDDPLIDFGSNGREDLQKSWETIFHKIKSKGAQTAIHLHSTSNPLFWDTEYLSVIDSHVGDPLYQTNRTQELLESKDKFLKASLTVNDFDLLIKNRILSDSHGKVSGTDVNEQIAEAWVKIKHEKVNPDIFLDSVDTMKARLTEVINRFGADRVLYAGPECGLKAYPTYDNAFECFRRVTTAIHSFQK